MNRWYLFGWFTFIVGYPIEWLIPALLWPFTFFVKKYVTTVYTSWLLFFVSLTWWAVNIAIIVFWLLAALKYKTDEPDVTTLFSKNEIWTAFGSFTGYAIITNSLYYWLFHRGASHPPVTTEED